MSLDEERSLATNVQVGERSSSPPTSSPPTSSPPQPQRLAVAEDERGQTRKSVVREIKRIDAWTNNLIDNGLFDKRHKKLFGKKQKEDEVRVEMDRVFKDIQDNLYMARKSLDNDDLPASEYYVAQALRAYEKALYAPSRTWRFSNVYAGPMWIYLVGFLVSVLVFYWFQLDANFLNLHVHIQEAALHATTWGTLGAILRGLWFLKDKVSDRRYRNSFRIYLISTPFLGGLFGAIFYFLIVSGLFIIAPAQAPEILANQTTISESNATTTTTQTGSANQANNTSERNVSTLAIIPLAALAGFNWEWAIMILKRIGESFKGEMEPEDKIDR
ncbi:MAG TPA: hypothetical protein VKA87_09495 [Nitrososphaeraceae archaeon]|nr:hypothetical protein [Nitrososphaeraceae archaeon]